MNERMNDRTTLPKEGVTTTTTSETGVAQQQQQLLQQQQQQQRRRQVTPGQSTVGGIDCGSGRGSGSGSGRLAWSPVIAPASLVPSAGGDAPMPGWLEMAGGSPTPLFPFHHSLGPLVHLLVHALVHWSIHWSIHPTRFLSRRRLNSSVSFYATTNE